MVQDHLYNVLGISLIFYAMERETDSSWAGIWIFQGGFPGGSDGKESACNAGDLGSNTGLGRCPGEENGYLCQYSCLGNSMDRGA